MSKEKEQSKLYHSEKIQKFPSESYGKAIGLDSIYKNWILPDGETAESIILKVIDDPYKIYTELVNLNPELEDLDSSNELKEHYSNNFSFGELGRDIYYHLCYGVISKFSVRDINHFLKKGCYNNEFLKKHLDSRRKWYNVLKTNGVSIGWAASTETLKEISKYLEINCEEYCKEEIEVK